MNGLSETGIWVFLIPIVAIIGGFVMAGLNIFAQVRKREFAHRERLAMIEKGLVPPAEPATGREILSETDHDAWTRDRAAHTRRGGFIVIAVGIGLSLLISLNEGGSSHALGIGGFLVILGAAIYLSSYFGLARDDRERGNRR